ncbi:MAG: cytochrome c [Alphaproteobacteria bacterium]|jgi:cytochrome c556|nr:cytochrome c [Alphaproteobacteria bacterium]
MRATGADRAGGLKLGPGGTGRRIGLVITAALMAGAASAAALSGADAAKDRQTHMKELGKAMKTIVDQLHSGSPDVGQIKLAAATIDKDAKALPSWFPDGSGPSTGVKMKALPVVWTDKTDFAAKAHTFQIAAAKFDAAAQTGQASAYMPALKEVGGACKACHEKFRTKDED